MLSLHIVPWAKSGAVEFGGQGGFCLNAEVVHGFCSSWHACCNIHQCHSSLTLGALNSHLRRQHHSNGRALMRVLLASDGSADAMRAAKFVAELGLRNDLDVYVVTVTSAPDPALMVSMEPWMPVWTVEQQQAADRRVSQIHVDILSMLSDTCDDVSMSHKTGDPATCILLEAKEHDVDMIVLGAHGHSMIERMLIGSVSDYVATHADCSVVVVRTGSEEVSEHAPEEVRIRNVLVAYDQSKGAREAVAEMMQLDWSRETNVNVLTVMSPPFPLEEDSFNVLDENWEPERVQETRCAGERMASQIADRMPNTTSQLMRERHVGDSIVRNAEETDCDLLVVGESGHNLLRRLVLGSTTKYLLRHSPCTVWISRHHRNSEGDDSNHGESVHNEETVSS